MSRNLQTGKSTAYLQYISTGNNANVESTESEINGNAAIVKLTLTGSKPAPEDQSLQSISIDDQEIIDNFIDHIKSVSIEMVTYELVLQTQEENLSFVVTPTLTTQGDFRTLCFMVHNS